MFQATTMKIAVRSFLLQLFKSMSSWDSSTLILVHGLPFAPCHHV